MTVMHVQKCISSYVFHGYVINNLAKDIFFGGLRVNVSSSSAYHLQTMDKFTGNVGNQHLFDKPEN